MDSPLASGVGRYDRCSRMLCFGAGPARWAHLSLLWGWGRQRNWFSRQRPGETTAGAHVGSCWWHSCHRPLGQSPASGDGRAFPWTRRPWTFSRTLTGPTTPSRGAPRSPEEIQRFCIPLQYRTFHSQREKAVQVTCSVAGFPAVNVTPLLPLVWEAGPISFSAEPQLHHLLHAESLHSGLTLPPSTKWRENLCLLGNPQWKAGTMDSSLFV